MDASYEKLLVVAVNLKFEGYVGKRPSWGYALDEVCKMAEIHLHPRVRERLEKQHGPR